MSNYIFNINNGIIIQHVKDTSNEYVEQLYNSLPINIQEQISTDDIETKLINHMVNISNSDLNTSLNSKKSKSDKDSKPDCFEILDKWIVFGGKEFEIFLSKFIRSFDKINLNNGISKCLINICEYYNIF